MNYDLFTPVQITETEGFKKQIFLIRYTDEKREKSVKREFWISPTTNLIQQIDSVLDNNLLTIKLNWNNFAILTIRFEI